LAVKTFSGFMFLFALGMLANAFSNRWAFDPVKTGTTWVALDVLIAFVLAAVSYFAYVASERAELARSIGMHRLEMEHLERIRETREADAEGRPDDA
jgi:hypothetical protein